MGQVTAWRLLRKLMFQLDAEHAHHLVVSAIAELNDMAPFLVQRISGVLEAPAAMFKPEVFGLQFASVLGLAAGFDKNAHLVSALPNLGFGFCEIGTVTPLAQGGNPRPRLLREAPSQSLFNRMGFNNDGAVVIAANLARHKKHLPPTFRVGVNVGKNKDTSGTDIARDYARATRPFLDLADFIVINVSSPNTPGLRALQAREALAPILDAVQTECARPSRALPVLVKLAPELLASELQTLIEFFDARKISGLVLTNTLAGQTELGPGGWSGGRVRERAGEVLACARQLTSMPIIAVGGIDTPQVAQRRLEQGADLLELYTGWVFGGPKLPIRIATASRV